MRPVSAAQRPRRHAENPHGPTASASAHAARARERRRRGGRRGHQGAALGHDADRARLGHPDRLGDRRGEVVARAVGERPAVDDRHGDRLAGEEDRHRRAARQRAVGDAEQRVAHHLSARGVAAVEAGAEPGRTGGAVDRDAGGQRRGVGGLDLGAGDQRAHGEAADLVGAPTRQEGAVGRDHGGSGLPSTRRRPPGAGSAACARPARRPARRGSAACARASRRGA